MQAMDLSARGRRIGETAPLQGARPALQVEAPGLGDLRRGAGAWAGRIADATRRGHGDGPRAADLDGGFGVGTMLFVTAAAGVVTHYGWIGLASPWLMPTTVLFGRVAG